MASRSRPSSFRNSTTAATGSTMTSSMPPATTRPNAERGVSMRRISRMGSFNHANSAATTTTTPITEMKAEDWNVVSRLPGNGNCIDCNAKYPEWGSVNFGILFCTRCCSGHRSLGTHISRVKSIRMDAWTDRQVKMMIVGGNQSFTEWFEGNGIELAGAKSYSQKYDNETARLYTEVLKARVEGRREPITVHEVKRQLRWNKPKELYRKFILGEDSNGNVSRERRNILRRIANIHSSSDFWLFAYVLSLVGWATLFVVWNYGGYFLK